MSDNPFEFVVADNVTVDKRRFVRDNRQHNRIAEIYHLGIRCNVCGLNVVPPPTIMNFPIRVVQFPTVVIGKLHRLPYWYAVSITLNVPSVPRVMLSLPFPDLEFPQP